VVHRMFQARIPGDLPPDALAAKACTLVTADESLTVADLGRLAASAAEVFSGMRSQPALRTLLDEAECHYEVPISVRPATGEAGGRARILRGVIDCLACRPDGGVVVVDFKTGARRPGDRRQLAAYVGAVRALYPGTPVEGLLVYAGTDS
jgi:ATP-dependent exoDNAse (exonuclease V) beta subunit